VNGLAAGFAQEGNAKRGVEAAAEGEEDSHVRGKT
jgi:hypothetical protein